MVLHMNWDYVSGKKQKWKIKTKEQKREFFLKKSWFFYTTLVSVLKKIMSKSVIYLLFNYQTVYNVTFPAQDIYWLLVGEYIS